MRRITLVAAAATLGMSFVPLGSATASPAASSCSSTLFNLGGWEQTCQFTVAPGSGVLSLTINSGTGFVSVTCASGTPLIPATITRSSTGTTTESYERAGTCELVAGGTGDGYASAT